MLGTQTEKVEKEFLSIQDLSWLLGVKVSTLYALVEERRVPHYRIGRLIRFSRSEINLWLERQRQACTDVNKEAARVLRALRGSPKDIGKLVKKAIAGTKAEGYTIPHGKPDQVKGLGKEVPDGTV
ncbi:MAG: helix-turn-helix domain-containing protein [Deltaproteobacteria bacterium]|nr:helix-turn-helix domain-containing protein [Deltaproteobacteria bacterium]